MTDTTTRWLKWENDVIGTIDANDNVHFSQPNYNEVVTLYTHGTTYWPNERFVEFLSERIVNRNRRDIERILFRCGLSHFDVLQIARITRGVNPKDLLWVAHSKDEQFNEAITSVFDSVFNQQVDMVGESIDTPEGCNIKRYGVYDGRYGIFKQRISPLSTDVESEVAVYLLSQKLGVPCCPATRVDKDLVFSTFLYDFSQEYIVHFRRLFKGARGNNEYQNLVAVRPQFEDDIARMILLDFVTRQDDRHLSNIAIKISHRFDTSSYGETFYPLYDNGRSLFYEDTEVMVHEAIANPTKFATSFGFTGTYWDYAKEIAERRGTIAGLVNLNISEDEVHAILLEAGFEGYRLFGATKWIAKTLELLRGFE
ncbi:MAG: hypothetical protein LBG97_04130 [Coriobacteriales bacterium]|nr:hypothetical protein [Coriobacteriales bacterium]